MEIYEKLLWGITFWTFCEGALLLIWPKGAIALGKRIFSKLGPVFSEMTPSQLRTYGAVEFGFGILLGSYLFWAG